MGRFEQYRQNSLDEIIQALDTHAQAGSDTYQFLQNLLLARIAQVVQQSLLGHAETVGKSANDLGSKIDRLNKEIGETKAKIETAGKNVSDALAEAGKDFRTASEQSSRLGRRLNWLTGILVAAALISTAATAFYAWETKRQLDLMELQSPIQRSPDNPNSLPRKQ